MLGNHHTLHLVGAFVDLGGVGDSSIASDVPIAYGNLSVTKAWIHQVVPSSRDGVGMKRDQTLDG